MLNAAEEKDEETFIIQGKKFLESMRKINKSMQKMWVRSRGAGYGTLRSWIFGVRTSLKTFRGYDLSIRLWLAFVLIDRSI
jgi:hypothetical protein